MTRKYLKIGMLFSYAVLVFLLFFRAFLSVDLTDEVHGIASVYNIYLGKKPFMTSWDYHTGWCLLVPFFGVYQFLFPNLEGIVLYFRILYLIFSILCVIGIGCLLKDKKVLFYLFPIICFIPTSTFQINYNSFIIYLLMLVMILLLTSDREKTEAFRYGITGILMGLACITYPTVIGIAALLCIWIIFYNRNLHWKRKTLCYIGGGCAVAAVFLLWIFWNGSYDLFQASIEGMLSSPHEQSKGAINLQFLTQTFYVPVKTYLQRPFGVLLAGYALIQLLLYIGKGFSRKNVWSKLVLLFFLAVNAWVNKGIYGYTAFGILCAFAIEFLKNKAAFKKYMLLPCILLILYVLTYAFSSDNKNVLIAFEIAGPMICLIAALWLWKTDSSRNSILIYGILFMIGVSGLFNVYAYVYRDEPVKELRYQVKEGIYKGLYTTRERKIFVEEAEKELTEYIQQDETICVVTRAPMVYLMTKAQICAPQTWDAQFLARGYTSAEPLLSYFRAVNQLPDVLVASSLDISDFYENAKYEIHEFINRYYSFYHVLNIEGENFWIWKRIDQPEL